MPEVHPGKNEEESKEIGLLKSKTAAIKDQHEDLDEKGPIEGCADECSEVDESCDFDSIYDFDAFISKMRHESCKPVLEAIKRFIKVFLEKLPEFSSAQEMTQAYRSFYSTIRVKCLQAEVWQEATAAERANAHEGLESLLMNQLHDRALAFDSSDVAMDNFLENKMALYGGWLQLHHLDIGARTAEASTGDSWIYSAVTEFQKMSVYRTPRDKVVCALNGCRIINSFTFNFTEVQESGSNTGSADDFLPLLIYTLIRANPPQIHSNLEFISRFRAPERITGESAYFFTHLMAAVEFIEKMDQASLSISPEAFENFMQQAEDELKLTMSTDSLPNSEDLLGETLDQAELKAEQFFLKAKAAFRATGERANQAILNIRESSLAKKSMEKINRLVRDMATPSTAREQDSEEAALNQALISSLMEESAIITDDLVDEKNAETEDAAEGAAQAAAEEIKLK